MDRFNRPYIVSSQGRKRAQPRHPYDRTLFKQYSVYPLLVLDTGAFLLCMDKLGAADSDTLLATLADGTLFGHWTRNGIFEWDLHHRLTSRSTMRNTAELQAWINRLYFLLPVAQQFLLTRSEEHARRWFELFADWQDKHLYTEKKVRNFYKESDLVWFDMQVCWRTLVLMHSVYLLAGSKFMIPVRWKRVYAAIESGIQLLLKEAIKSLASGHGRGNHFLQKGTVLLYAGLCFPEFACGAACLKTGRAIVEKLMRTDIFSDGGSVEASPSYSHFIGRQFVEAYVLLKKNRQREIPGLLACIRRQYAWMNQMASPSRRTLQFNDSCSLDVDRDLKIVSQLMPLHLEQPKRSALFPASRAGKLGHGRFELYFDAMPQTNFWHDHHGRPNVVLFVEGHPLLVDSGAPNYDHFLRENCMALSPAHNVLQIHEKLEYTIGEEWQQPFPEVQIAYFKPGRMRSEVRFIHRFAWPKHRLSYIWTRNIALDAQAVYISDVLRSQRPLSATQHFHFAPLNMQVAPDGRHATIFFNGRDIHFEQTARNPAGPLKLAYKPAFDASNHMTYAPCLSAFCRGTKLNFSVRISVQ